MEHMDTTHDHSLGGEPGAPLAPEAHAGDAAAASTGAASASEASQGGDSGITHPAKRQHTEQSPLETGGEDTLHLALNVWWKDDFEGIMAALERGKMEAQARGRSVELDYNGLKVVVARQGKKTGGGRGRFYRYIAHVGSVTMLVTDQPQAVDQYPNVLVEIGSALLMYVGGAGNAMEDLRDTLFRLGGHILWAKVSRVDLCVDLPETAISVFHVLVQQDLDVTRAVGRVEHLQHRRITGIMFGTGSIVLRLYDKLLEVTGPRHDQLKLALLCERRWGTLPNSAVRIEYQVRREMLVGAGIATFEDYLQQRASLARYLTHDWFRFAASPPDRENHNTRRVDTHPLWVQVQQAFEAWTGTAPESIRRLKHRPEVDPIRLAKQGRGCLISALAELEGVEPMSEHDLRAKAVQILDWAFDQSTPIRTVERFEEKRLRAKREKL
jgi:hypothetical protein